MLCIQKFLREGGTPEQLKERFAIDAKRHREYPNLVLFKYDQIDSPFAEEIVRECRGIILDEKNDWNVVCWSMPKFFNHGEGHAAAIDWTKTIVYEKVDGSLCQLFAYNGLWHIATSGSPDAAGSVGDYFFSFKELFWKTFPYKLPSVSINKCFFFELTSIYNKIVVVHEKPSITLLGGRDLTTLKELALADAAKFFPKCNVAKQFPIGSFDDVVKSFDTFSGLKQEGYVVFDGTNRVKCKHPQYVQLHHLKDSLGSSRRALVEVARKGEIDEVIAVMPEYKDILVEAKTRLDALVSELEATYEAIKGIELQKDFAIEACKTRCPAALFSFRAKKVPSIRFFLREMNIDSIMHLLAYKTSNDVPGKV